MDFKQPGSGGLKATWAGEDLKLPGPGRTLATWAGGELKKLRLGGLKTTRAKEDLNQPGPWMNYSNQGWEGSKQHGHGRT